MTVPSKVLRKQNSLASTVTVFMRTNPHASCEIYRGTKMTVVKKPKHHKPRLLKVDEGCLVKIFREGYGYKKSVITVNEIIRWEDSEMSTFQDHSNEMKERMLMR